MSVFAVLHDLNTSGTPDWVFTTYVLSALVFLLWWSVNAALQLRRRREARRDAQFERRAHRLGYRKATTAPGSSETTSA